MDPLRIWFDPPHVRWGRVVVTGLVVTLLIGLWVAQRRGMFDDTQGPVAQGAKVAGVAASAATARREVVASPAAVPQRAAVPVAAASSVELVCGLGPVTFDPGDRAQFERLLVEAAARIEAHRDRVLPGWLEEMKSSADVQVQAAAWLMEARRAWLKSVESGSKSSPMDSLDELVRLAERTRDPLPYALAFQACEQYGQRVAVPACEALRAEAWAERDPGNAYPWLFAAGQDRLDAQRRGQYLERAIGAETVRSTWGAMHTLLARAAPPSEEPLDRSVRFFEAASADAVLSIGQSALLEHCSENELRHGPRRHQCERLATLLTEKSESLPAANVGVGIGRRLGWSADRLERHRVRLDALEAAMPGDPPLGPCGGLARGEAFFADVAKHGELGALRRRQQAAQSTTTAAR